MKALAAFWRVLARVFGFNPQRVVCAWCDRTMRLGVSPVSHGMCLSCSVPFRADIERHEG